MKISNKRSNKMTNEKPVKISLDFKDAVAALLKVKPPPKPNCGPICALIGR